MSNRYEVLDMLKDPKRKHDDPDLIQAYVRFLVYNINRAEDDFWVPREHWNDPKHLRFILALKYAPNSESLVLS